MQDRVETALGVLEGRRRGGVREWLGVPFAAPPVGALRFRPPQPAEPWAGVRSALEPGAAAPQGGLRSRLADRMAGGGGGRQESCLFLNIWAPDRPAARRPVLVWIHGGGFVLGSGSLPIYRGAALARRGDLVVVTLNYRLGALGFLDLSRVAPPGTPSTANLGLRDQIAALAWVSEHIAAFGGDPDRVTVFGESAGAMSVGTLLGTPAARGLFRRAILQSGAARNVSSPERAEESARLFLERLGAPPELEALQALPLEQILAAQLAVSGRLSTVDGRLPWQPSLDGDLLATPPLEAIRSGLSAGVDTLVGTNLDEWRLFMLGDRKGRRLDEHGLRRRLERTLGLDVEHPGLRRELAERAHGLYRELGRGASAGARWSAFQSDRIFHLPALDLARAQSVVGAATYAYRFDWPHRWLPERLGACHALEIPFVFGTLKAAPLRAFLGADRRALALSSRMQDAWIAFARGGDPGHPRIPEWPRFDGQPAHLVFDRRCRVERDWLAGVQDFWEKLS